MNQTTELNSEINSEVNSSEKSTELAELSDFERLKQLAEMHLDNVPEFEENTQPVPAETINAGEVIGTFYCNLFPVITSSLLKLPKKHLEFSSSQRKEITESFKVLFENLLPTISPETKAIMTIIIISGAMIGNAYAFKQKDKELEKAREKIAELEKKLNESKPKRGRPRKENKL